MIVLLILFVSQVQREGLKGEQVCRMDLPILGIQAVAEERPQLWGWAQGYLQLISTRESSSCMPLVPSGSLGSNFLSVKGYGSGIPDYVERNIVTNVCLFVFQGAPGPRGHQGLPGPPGAPVSHYSLIAAVPNIYRSRNV
jgi:hypothetical protein